jgi:hypothetical protein
MLIDQSRALLVLTEIIEISFKCKGKLMLCMSIYLFVFVEVIDLAASVQNESCLVVARRHFVDNFYKTSTSKKSMIKNLHFNSMLEDNIEVIDLHIICN